MHDFHSFLEVLQTTKRNMLFKIEYNAFYSDHVGESFGTFCKFLHYGILIFLCFETSLPFVVLNTISALFIIYSPYMLSKANSIENGRMMKSLGGWHSSKIIVIITSFFNVLLALLNVLHCHSRKYKRLGAPSFYSTFSPGEDSEFIFFHSY